MTYLMAPFRVAQRWNIHAATNHPRPEGRGFRPWSITLLCAAFMYGAFVLFDPVTCYAKGPVVWKELKSDHFIVSFVDNDSFTKDVLDKAEIYYHSIATELGYPRYSEFWLWNDRVKIIIYPDHDSFLEATGREEWSEGVANYEKKQICSYAWSSGFLESLLPHEMTHLIFRDFVGFKGEVPLWLDEGVAQWTEETQRIKRRQASKKCYEEDGLLSIEDMMAIDVHKLPNKSRVLIRSTKTKSGDEGVLFLSPEAIVNLFYLQGFSLVDFLIERFGTDDFTFFCRQLRDGKNLEEALRFAYPSHIRSLQELEEKWREYLNELN